MIYITRLRRCFPQSPNEGRLLAEKQSRTGIVYLHASIKDRGNIIAKRDSSLFKAAEHAEKAEETGILEDISRSSSSGPDSALQKRQKTVEGLKHACEQATKDGDTTRRDLQDARVLAGKNNKKATELQTRVTGLLKRNSELEAQVQEKDASIGRKDGSMTKMHGEKQELVKDMRTVTAERDGALKKNETDTKVKDEKPVGQLKAQVAGASHLRSIAEPRTSKQEVVANEAAKQQKVAEERATQKETRVAKVEDISEAVRAKASRAEASAAEIAEQLRSKDTKIVTLKAEAESSYRYLQRCLDTAEATNTDLIASLAREKADAKDAEVDSRTIQP